MEIEMSIKFNEFKISIEILDIRIFPKNYKNLLTSKIFSKSSNSS